MTSIETRIMFLGKLVFSMKLIKSVVSLRYDSCICVIDGVRRSTNNESRPVGPSHPILSVFRRASVCETL